MWSLRTSRTIKMNTSRVSRFQSLNLTGKRSQFLPKASPFLRQYKTTTRLLEEDDYPSPQITKYDEAEATELRSEIQTLFKRFEGKSKQEIQKMFEKESFQIEKLFQRVSLNPLLDKEMKEAEKKLFEHAKEGNIQKQVEPETNELEEVLYSFKPNTIYVLESFLPRLFSAYEREVGAEYPSHEPEDIPEGKKRPRSRLEKLILVDGLMPPSLKTTINRLHSEEDREDIDPFRDLVTRLRGHEMTTVDHEFRNRLKDLSPDEFKKAANQMRADLKIISDEAEELDRLRRKKAEGEEDVGWIIRDPQDITEQNIGKYFSVNAEKVLQMFPEGMGRLADKEFDVLPEPKTPGVLVRPEAFELIQMLAKGRENGFLKDSIPPFTVLDGERGSGKSSILNTLVYWARATGWIVVRMEGRNWSEDDKYQLTESQAVPGLFNNPIETIAFCQQQLSAHKEQLAQLPITEEFTIEGFNRTPQSTLADLMEFGGESDNFDTCGDVLYYYRRELSYVTKFPVLFVLDEVNCFFNQSTGIIHPELWHKYYRGGGVTPIDHLVGAKAFGNFQNHGLMNGTCVCALSTMDHNEQFFKRTGLKRDTFVQIPPLRRDEFNVVLDWFVRNAILQSTMTERTRQYIFAMTSGKGNELLNYSMMN